MMEFKRVLRIVSKAKHKSPVTGAYVPDETAEGDFRLIAQDEEKVYVMSGMKIIDGVPFVEGYSKKDYIFFDSNEREIKFTV